jgi:riboflavin kinase/FMN adenylyltransferase
MDVVSGIASLPLDAERTVATVGFFDGVHLGHRAVLQRAVGVAAERARPSVAVTFDRHPREVISPETAPKLLTTMER